MEWHDGVQRRDGDGVIPQHLGGTEPKESSRTQVLTSKDPNPGPRGGVGCEGLSVLCKVESSSNFGGTKMNCKNRWS